MGPQDGHAIVIGALTMLFVMMAAMLTYQVGMLVDRKIELQNAADSAAYSGATMKAVCVNTIEWISGCMVYTYNNMLSYSFDTMYFAGTTETGHPTDISNYGEAYSQAGDWIERGHDWLERLGEMQVAIANAAPRMIHNEVVDTARRNGADYVAVWPDYENYEYFVNREDSLNCVFDVSSTSALISSNTDYILRIRRNNAGSRMFEFSLHDPVYATAGVDTGDACSFYVERGGSSRIVGNHVYAYDGTRYDIDAIWPIPIVEGEGEDAVVVDYFQVSITGSAPQLILINEEIGSTPFYLSARISGVEVWLGYILSWNGGNPRAELYSIETIIGETYVLSEPASLAVEGYVSNPNLGARFYTGDSSVWVDGFDSDLASPDFIDYGNWRSRLYRRPGGFCFEKQARLVDAFPFFVEDNYPRFIRRGVSSPSGSRIDRYFGRTLQGNDFSVRVHPEMRRTIITVPQWDTFGIASPDYQSVDLMRTPMPLVISDEFIRYGVSVGCYKELYGFILYQKPSHGIFAVACARLGKRSSTRSPYPDDTLKILHLPGGDIEFFENRAYSTVRVSDGIADRRSRVDTTGSQGYWYPVLMPIKEMMIGEDLATGGFLYGNSAAMVFHRLIDYSYWRAEAFGDIYAEIPERIRNDFLREEDGEPFDFFDEEMQNALQH